MEVDIGIMSTLGRYLHYSVTVCPYSEHCPGNSGAPDGHLWTRTYGHLFGHRSFSDDGVLYDGQNPNESDDAIKAQRDVLNRKIKSAKQRSQRSSQM